VETTIAEIVCIVLILGGLALYFWLRIGLTFNAPGFAGRTFRNLGFRTLVLLLTGIGLVSSALVLLEE